MNSKTRAAFAFYEKKKVRRGKEPGRNRSEKATYVFAHRDDPQPVMPYVEEGRVAESDQGGGRRSGAGDDVNTENVRDGTSGGWGRR
jgi:hypothetical protein